MGQEWMGLCPRVSAVCAQSFSHSCVQGLTLCGRLLFVTLLVARQPGVVGRERAGRALTMSLVSAGTGRANWVSPDSHGTWSGGS